MKYFELIYYFLGFAPGVTLNIFMIIMYLKYKNTYIGLFTMVYMSTSFLVLYYLINNFIIFINYDFSFEYMAFLEVMFMSLIIWAATTLILKVFYEGINKVQKLMILALSLVPLAAYSLWFFGVWNTANISDIYYIYFILILIVDCLLFMLKYKQINQKSFRKLGKVIVSILSIFLVLFILQSYIPKFKFDTFPLFYLLLSGQLIFFVWKYFINDNIDEVFNIRNSFIEEYNITKREQEIIQLIQDGYTNNEISTELFLSEKTVANHIYNIYKKLNIKSRFELICLFKK